MTEPRRYLSRTEARQAFDKANVAFTVSYATELAAYLANTRKAIASVTDQDGAAARLFAALGLHLPEERHIGLNGAHCQECAWVDEDEHDYGREVFPCDTFEHLAAALGFEEPPKMTGRPVFKDFWIDPYVTVTFAHPCMARAVYEGEPRQYLQGSQATLTLGEAERVKRRLVTTSRQRVEALS